MKNPHDDKRFRCEFSDAYTTKRDQLTCQNPGFAKGRRSRSQTDLGIPGVSMDFDGGCPDRITQSSDSTGIHDTKKETAALYDNKDPFKDELEKTTAPTASNSTTEEK